MRFYPFVFTGERRLKLTGESNRLDVNADFMTTGTLLNTPTLYPSAYLVLTSKGYTKHYYAGADRVAASLGGGVLKATGSNPGMQERADWLFWESHERVNGRMLQENDHKCIWQSSLPTGEYCKPIDSIPGRMKASVEFYLNDLYDNLKMLAEEQHDEKDVYFYHSDHLGSASWITDADGKPIQHLQYLPFGEPFVNQHLTDYQERYLFTGKERDEETGYGYFGARYMDHELLTSFISVDRYASKYPFISPYAYCAWNPIKLIDPTGDTLFALNRQSQIDIMNLAGPYRRRILFDDRGLASIDHSGLSDEEINKMNANLGVGLIKDISDSPLKILYESSDMIQCTEKDGKEIGGYLGNDNNGVLNLSRGGLDANNDHTFLPREGFDGQVIVSPNGMWSSGGFHVDRLEIVGHELAENYARTVHNCNYRPDKNGATSMAQIGAHEYANQRMLNINKEYTYKHNKRKN